MAPGSGFISSSGRIRHDAGHLEEVVLGLVSIELHELQDVAGEYLAYAETRLGISAGAEQEVHLACGRKYASLADETDLGNLGGRDGLFSAVVCGVARFCGSLGHGPDCLFLCGGVLLCRIAGVYGVPSTAILVTSCQHHPGEQCTADKF